MPNRAHRIFLYYGGPVTRVSKFSGNLGAWGRACSPLYTCLLGGSTRAPACLLACFLARLLACSLARLLACSPACLLACSLARCLLAALGPLKHWMIRLQAPRAPLQPLAWWRRDSWHGTRRRRCTSGAARCQGLRMGAEEMAESSKLS